jgi:hypothetical protein
VFAQGRLTVWIHWNTDRLDLLVGDSFWCYSVGPCQEFSMIVCSMIDRLQWCSLKYIEDPFISGFVFVVLLLLCCVFACRLLACDCLRTCCCCCKKYWLMVKSRFGKR